ncbi:MAG: MATE family efflux transporter [Coriobacteriaceae bacterium]|nr:MATE family efflux transporter [Coriobacteriaceae bacterium]
MTEEQQSNRPDKQELKNKERVDRLGSGKISKLMLEFAIPSIIGLVVNGFYNIIDSIFLGHALGTVGQATATIAMPIMTISMAVSLLIGQGGNALAALRLGEGKHDEAERIMGNTFTLTLIASVICTAVVWLFMDPVLSISGATEETWESSHIFMAIIAGGFFFQFFGLGFNNFIRTAGDPNRALYTMVIGTFVCIILNYLFVMVLDWGVAGSAWATIIGQAVSAVLMLWYFIFSRKAPFKLRFSQLRLRTRLVTTTLALGSASFVLQIAAAVVTVILNQQLGYYGALSAITSDGALATIGVVNRIAMFSFFPLLGVAIAAQPIFGFNYGAKNYERVKDTFKVAMIWIMSIGITFWILIHLFPRQIVNIFGIEPYLLEFTVNALQVQLFLIPLMGLQIIASHYFQSSGQPFKSMFLSLTRQLLYLIPLIYGMPYIITNFGPDLIPLDGLYYAYPVADFFSVVTATIFMIFEFKKLDAKILARDLEREKEQAA